MASHAYIHASLHTSYCLNVKVEEVVLVKKVSDNQKKSKDRQKKKFRKVKKRLAKHEKRCIISNI